MQLEFNIAEQTLTMTNKKNVVADSLNYLTCKFTFSEEWNGLTKTAVFISNTDSVYNMIITNDCCDVPHEVIKSPSFKVSVFGGNRITTNLLTISVTESGYEEGEISEEITPDLYEQIMSTSKKTYANALVGNKSGELVNISDISPLSYEAQVTVISNDKVTLYKTGKNLLPQLVYKTTAGITTEDAIFIKAGTYRLSIKEITNCTLWRLMFKIYDLEKNQVTGTATEGIVEYFKVNDNVNNRFYLADGTLSWFSINNNNILFKNNCDRLSNIEISLQFLKDCYISLAIIQGYLGDATSATQAINSQLEVGTVVTEYEGYTEPVAYEHRYDGYVEGLKTLSYPVTNLYTKSARATIEVTYTRDLVKVIEELTQAIISLGGNV